MHVNQHANHGKNIKQFTFLISFLDSFGGLETDRVRELIFAYLEHVQLFCLKQERSGEKVVLIFLWHYTTNTYNL